MLFPMITSWFIPACTPEPSKALGQIAAKHVCCTESYLRVRWSRQIYLPGNNGRSRGFWRSCQEDGKILRLGWSWTRWFWQYQTMLIICSDLYASDWHDEACRTFPEDNWIDDIFVGPQLTTFLQGCNWLWCCTTVSSMWTRAVLWDAWKYGLDRICCVWDHLLCS